MPGLPVQMLPTVDCFRRGVAFKSGGTGDTSSKGAGGHTGDRAEVLPLVLGKPDHRIEVMRTYPGEKKV
jgi:hypothetical protein